MGDTSTSPPSSPKRVPTSDSPNAQTATPGPNDILISVSSIALNPIDHAQRDFGFALSTFPAVIGSDVAGTISARGSSVITFKEGARVAAFTPTFFVGGDLKYGALQQQVLVPASNSVELPPLMSFNEASLLPMAVTTAWSGCCWDSEVYATASEKHHEYLKKLSASKIFDYKDSDVVAKIVKAAKEDGVTLAKGFDAVGQVQPCADILKEFSPAKLATSKPFSDATPKVDGVDMLFVAAPFEGKANTDFFSFVWNEWLDEKLKKGDFVPSPSIKVIAGGLEAINKGLDELKQGVSGVKLVLEV